MHANIVNLPVKIGIEDTVEISHESYRNGQVFTNFIGYAYSPHLGQVDNIPRKPTNHEQSDKR